MSFMPARAEPTVSNVLDLDVVRRGRPQIVAGASGLSRAVRWTHISELADVGPFLRGGELLLTTGMGFPESDSDLCSYIEDLDEAGCAALVVELGRRYQDALPNALADTASDRGLPVIALRRETPFVEVTEAVHALIVDAQLNQLRMSEEVHRTFTELSMEGATPQSIIRQTVRMVGVPVVLENLSHQVLAFDSAGASPEVILDRWEARSRSVHTTSGAGYDERLGWVLSSVGARGENWGRLVLVCDAEPTPREYMVVERAAAALALSRLLDRDQESLEEQSHRSLLLAILRHEITAHDLYVQAKSLGVPVEGKALVGVALRPAPGAANPLEGPALLRAVAAATTTAARGTPAVALAGVVDARTVGAVLATSQRSRFEAVLDQWAHRLRQELSASMATASDVQIAAGSVVADVTGVRRSLLEAMHVADVGRAGPAIGVMQLADAGLPGLMHLLRDDERVQTYVEREIGLLLLEDQSLNKEQASKDSLLAVLRSYLSNGRNKSAAASALGVSRPTFYQRIARIEKLLGRDLEDESTLLTLHVALVALDAIRAPR